jgi:starvation-inducible outer membrane lipoprotein
MKFILASLCVLLFAGCSTVPVAEKQKFPLPPPDLMQDPPKLKTLV